MNHLNPKLSTEGWTVQEDEILITQQSLFGNAWVRISHFLPGRSLTSIKNRWGFVAKRLNANRRMQISPETLSKSTSPTAFPVAKFNIDSFEVFGYGSGCILEE
jgi:hypothetical protein